MGKYKAIIGERELEVDLRSEEVLIDGKVFPCDFRVLRNGLLHFLVDGKSYPVMLRRNGEGLAEVSVGRSRTEVIVKSERDVLLDKYGLDSSQNASASNLKSPMPGLVVRIAVKAGEEVSRGDALLVLEAMKMENELKAEASGIVSSVHVSEGDAVTKGQLLIEIDSTS